MNLITTHYGYHIELLQHLVRGKLHRHTTVIICLPRADFLRQIAIQAHRRESASSTKESSEVQPTESQGAYQTDTSTVHDLLTPALRLLAISQEIQLAYCPTIPSLRGYLSTYHAQHGANLPRRSHLIVVDLLALHHGTSEFTLQGLSRTFAVTVSAARACAADLTLLECKNVEDPTDPDRGSRLWEKQVPLLSGSVRIGLEGSRWAGRALTIRKIASRWFNFQDNAIGMNVAE